MSSTLSFLYNKHFITITFINLFRNKQILKKKIREHKQGEIKHKKIYIICQMRL